MVLIDFLVNWGLGWRYLLSPSFRYQVHGRWAKLSVGNRVFEGVFCLLAFAVLNGFIVLTVLWLYDGIVAPRLAPM